MEGWAPRRRQRLEKPSHTRPSSQVFKGMHSARGQTGSGWEKAFPDTGNSASKGQDGQHTRVVRKI